MSLEGKVALVTGGSRGIGRAIALAFAERGAKVAFCHPGDEAAAQTLAEIKARSDGVDVVADVADEAQVEAFFDLAAQALGTPDILVNNAGILRESPLAQTVVAEFDRVIAVNLRGTFLAARAFVRRNESGRIINIASDLGILGREEMAAYTASKGAVIALTRTLAWEYLKQGVRVNAVAPGGILTPMVLAQGERMASLDMDLFTHLNRPDGQFGAPEQVAGVIAMLASADGAHMTGEVVKVDGGVHN